jgi:hypothetical protein
MSLNRSKSEKKDGDLHQVVPPEDGNVHVVGDEEEEDGLRSRECRTSRAARPTRSPIVKVQPLVACRGPSFGSRRRGILRTDVAKCTLQYAINYLNC